MKTTNQFFALIMTGLLMFSTISFAQNDAPQQPQYITVTTMYWNMDYDNFNMDEWKAVEKEFLDKVTKKNELILGASFYLHRYTADNTELIYVQSFANWEAIDKAGERNAELINEAWPNEDDRKAFFERRSAYYSDEHSDEIYATLPGAKLMTQAPTEDMVCYVRKSHLAFPKDGSGKEFNELRKEIVDNVINKNEYIKAYYPNVHAWGSDRTEFIEAFFTTSLADIEKMQERSNELIQAYWTNEEAQKAFGEKNAKYYKGTHGDYIYTFVAGLSK